MEAEAGRILFLWLNDLLQMALFHGIGGQRVLVFHSHRGAFSKTCLCSRSCLGVCGLTCCFVPAHVPIQEDLGDRLFHAAALLYPLAN